MVEKRGGPRKRRTREHVIADLSINHVERFALRSGYAVSRVQPDYGLDLMMFTYTARGDVENGLVFMQLKATDHLRWRKDRQAILVRIKRGDLVYWVGEMEPIMLIVYDAKQDRAYWLYIQGAMTGGQIFRLRRRGSTVTIHVPAQNVVNEDAMRQFARYKAERLAARRRDIL